MTQTEINEWKRLKREVKEASHKVYCTKNEKTELEFDTAIKNLCDFEKTHNIQIMATEAELKPQTNEEWLHTLNTEEMVDYLYSVHKGGASVERQLWIEEHKERVKMQIRGWLKAKRDGGNTE